MIPEISCLSRVTRVPSACGIRRCIQAFDGFAGKWMQAITARRYVRLELAAHHWIPELGQVIADALDGRGVIRFGGEVTRDVIGHGDQSFDIHGSSPVCAGMSRSGCV